MNSSRFLLTEFYCSVWSCIAWRRQSQAIPKSPILFETLTGDVSLDVRVRLPLCASLSASLSVRFLGRLRPLLLAFNVRSIHGIYPRKLLLSACAEIDTGSSLYRDCSYLRPKCLSDGRGRRSPQGAGNGWGNGWNRSPSSFTL